MPDPIEKRDSRDIVEQEAAIVAMFSQRDELTDLELRQVQNSLIHFRQAMGAYNGWGDKHLLDSAKGLVETFNQMQAEAKRKIVSRDLAESLRNLIYNHLLAGSYSGEDEDPTREWQEW